MKEPQAYKYDYSGSCGPATGMNWHGQHTFSVGIFQWLPRTSGKGLKKSAVVKRIKGFMSNPEDVYRRAQAVCDELNGDVVKP